MTDSVAELLELLRTRLVAELARRGWQQPQLVGIHSGGAWLARQLAADLGLPEPGTLDISFHRDDFGSSGLQPQVRPSRIPFQVEGAEIVLVDDILYTGRTVRAAINELFDYGRPRGVLLAVLISRDGRELPLQADACGATLELGPGRLLKLRGGEAGSADRRLWLEQIEVRR